MYEEIVLLYSEYFQLSDLFVLKGVVRVRRSLGLQQQAYNLSISAIDSNGLSSSSSAVVMVTVYNQTSLPRAVFTSQLYAFSVLENASGGSLVGMVKTNVYNCKCYHQFLLSLFIENSSLSLHLNIVCLTRANASAVT